MLQADILLDSFNYLARSDLDTCAMVCRSWHDLTKRENLPQPFVAQAVEVRTSPSQLYRKH